MSQQLPYRVAVTGSSGQMGRELAKLADSHPRFQFTFLDRDIFPLDEPEKIQYWIQKHPSDFFIHCAAYTAVDKAESEREKVFLVNATAPGLISTLLSKAGTKLIYISTDYVFDGTSALPLKEDAVTDPVNVYGSSKLEGEKLVLRNNPDTIVIRTSWLYSTEGNNFVKTMIRLMSEREKIQVVQDQTGSPTYAADLAGSILQILESGRFLPGIYHYSNEGTTTWYEFALEIKRLTASTCQVLPIPTSGYPTPAKRPAYSLLDKSKIRSAYDLEIPTWQSSLRICIEHLKNH
jgi:dTDP-4-dehydrorhamnose reductase